MSKNQNSEEITPRDVANFINDLKYWILGSVVVFLLFAWIYTRNAEKIYTATAKVFLDLDERYYNTIVSDEFAEIQRVTMPKTRTKVDYEMSILQSIPVLTAAVESRAMNVRYFTKPRGEREMEVYGSKVPVALMFCDLKLESYPQATVELALHDTASFSVEDLEVQGSRYDVDKMKNLAFGDTVVCGKYSFVISLTESGMEKISYENLRVETTSSVNVAYSFLEHLTLENKPVSQNIKLTNMVSIQFQNQNVQRSKDFVNALIDNYNALTFNERRDDIFNTINIIDKRLEELAKDSSEVMPVVQHYPYSQVESSLIQYLMQVREESLIALKSVSPTARIVDKATCSRISAKPNPKMVYIAAIFLGFLVPILIEILRRTFRTRVLFRTDIEQNCDLPILSVIPAEKGGKLFNCCKICRKVFSAPSRLKIYGNNLPSVITMTSFNYKENTYSAALQMAKSLAAVGKKVLLLDLNYYGDKYLAPDFLKMMHNEGAAAWIDEQVDDVKIQTIAAEGDMRVDFLSSGKSQRTSNELMNSSRFEELITMLAARYDHIILLPAPYTQYADTLWLNKPERMTLFVVRKSVTKLEEIEELQRIREESVFEKLSILYCE